MKKIAIIDDFEESCQLMTEVLSPYFQCEYLCDAEKALNFLYKYQPDLILLDYKMPYTNGIQLCKIIRDTKSIQNVPIIFVSGAVTADERIETLESGGDDFISKPFHPKELLLRVQKRIGLTQAQMPKQQLSEITVGNLQIHLYSRLVYIEGQEVILTPKQFDILQLLADNKNKLVSRDQFMKDIWGHTDVSSRNVDSQINYLKKKIEGFNGKITSVPSHGYRLDV